MRIHGKEKSYCGQYNIFLALKHQNTKEKKGVKKDTVPSATTELEIAESKNKLKVGIKELLKEIERFEAKTICQHNLS